MAALAGSGVCCHADAVHVVDLALVGRVPVQHDGFAAIVELHLCKPPVRQMAMNWGQSANTWAPAASACTATASGAPTSGVAQSFLAVSYAATGE